MPTLLLGLGAAEAVYAALAVAALAAVSYDVLRVRELGVAAGAPEAAAGRLLLIIG